MNIISIRTNYDEKGEIYTVTYESGNVKKYFYKIPKTVKAWIEAEEKAEKGE